MVQASAAVTLAIKERSALSVRMGFMRRAAMTHTLSVKVGSSC